MNIKAVIDNKDPDEFPSDMPMISPDDIEPYSKIFIAVSNEKTVDEIKEQIRHKKCMCLTYKELPYVLGDLGTIYGV